MPRKKGSKNKPATEVTVMSEAHTDFPEDFKPVEVNIDPNQEVVDFLKGRNYKIEFTRIEPGTYPVNGAFITFKEPQLAFKVVHEER